MRKVYIMKSGEFYKIGSAKNPQNRLLAFKTGNPRIELIYISKDLSNAYQVEHQLHNKFSKCSVGGEWFSANDEQAFLCEVKSFIKEIGTETNSTICNDDYHGTDSQDLIHLLFSPINEEIAKLENEIKEIDEENAALKKALMELGWEEEDINDLVKKAEESVSA